MLEINIVYFCTFELLARQYVNAMAGFQRKYGNNLALLQENVSGILLPDGNFVFFLDNGRERQLVLTTNDGNFVKSGSLVGKMESWMEPDSWDKSTSYSIVNFQGIKGLYFCIVHPKFPQIWPQLSFYLFYLLPDNYWTFSSQSSEWFVLLQ